MKSHYSDPTANTAIANVDRELRKQQNRDEQLKKAAAKSTAAKRQEEKQEMLPERRRELETAKRYQPIKRKPPTHTGNGSRFAQKLLLLCQRISVPPQGRNGGGFLKYRVTNDKPVVHPGGLCRGLCCLRD